MNRIMPRLSLLVPLLLLLVASFPAYSAAFSASSSPSPQPPFERPEQSLTNRAKDISTTTPLFHSFQFAPNGVCLSPRLFHDQRQYFTMRNVPGDGDCMFLAVALATATSMGLGANDALLQAIAKETRQVVAQVLSSPNGVLYIGQDRTVKARDLLCQATRQEGFTSTQEYLQQLQTQGREGGLYGGGPELTVLANVLRRPISIYELHPSAASFSENSMCRIVCKGTFGDGLFEDPCSQIPQSALLSAAASPNNGQNHLPEGAFSWHLHILVVDVSPGEKHACVLLPAKPPQPGADATLRP